MAYDSIESSSRPEPSFWNGGTILGGSTGLIGGVAGAAALFHFAAPAVLTALSAGWSGVSSLGGAAAAVTGGLQGALAAAGAPVLIGAAAIALAVLAIGTYVGGKMGQAHERNKFGESGPQSLALHLQQSVSPDLSPSVQQAMDPQTKKWGIAISTERSKSDEPVRQA